MVAELEFVCERPGVPDVTEKLSSSAEVLLIDSPQTGVLRQMVNCSFLITTHEKLYEK